jgi:Domain of Unknown Function (DUF1080)
LQAPPPNTTGKPAANGTAAKRNAEPAAKPTFREPQPSKTVSAAPAKPAVPNVAKAPPKNVLPAVTRSVPSVSPPAVTTPAPKSTTQVAKSTPPVPATIPLKEVTTKPYDQAVVSVLVSDKKKLTSTWKPLFNGKDLTHWESSKFGGDGEVSVENGMIVLTEGGDMTGITYKGEVPTMNYALEVEAQRLDGVDFFAGVTFPVGETHMTLIPGGWAGGVFGLSSINGMDAADNETTQPRTFKDKQWYKFTIQVTKQRVQVLVDGKLEIDLETKDKTLSTRGEVESSKPLGIATWRTKAGIRSVQMRPLTPEEIQAAE